MTGQAFEWGVNGHFPDICVQTGRFLELLATQALKMLAVGGCSAISLEIRAGWPLLRLTAVFFLDAGGYIR